MFEIVIIAYHPESAISQLLGSLRLSKGFDIKQLKISIWDNSVNPESIAEVDQLVFNNPDLDITIYRCGQNLGFGRGVNRVIEKTNSPWVLVLNQDTMVLADTLARLQQEIPLQAEHVAAIELRQIPFEHPKDYNPVSLEISWITGAAFCIRKLSFDQIAGFDDSIFMYGEDVDFSWRLRSSGYVLKYAPCIAVIHETYRYAGEIKPLQVSEGMLTNLCLRARYGSYFDILKGLGFATAELFRKQTFEGRRLAISKIFPRYLKLFYSFRKSGQAYRDSGFTPQFLLWNYAMHRMGAFYEFPKNEYSSDLPLVSIVIRTINRVELLREALLSVLHQMYPNIEVIVVEDGVATSQSVIDEFSEVMQIKYIALGENKGRSVAGNVGLLATKGQWLGFLDDDDQFYADHIAVLMSEASKQQKKVVYSTAFEVQTKFLEHGYQETFCFTRFAEEFSAVRLLKHNFLPIQSVLFHRSVYEEHGGFDEDIDQLEDWLLWMRYALNHEFLFVKKTTSRYRVPAESKFSIDRKRKLYQAYNVILKKQESLSKMQIKPEVLRKQLDDYSRSEVLIGLRKQSVRDFLVRHQNQKIFVYLHQIRDLLRKLF